MVDEFHDGFRELVGTPRARPSGDQPRQPLIFEGRLSLVESGPREAEGRSRLRDRLSVDPHSAEHLVLDLDQVAGIEELAGLKPFVGDGLGTGIEHSVLGQCLAFGVHALGHDDLLSSATIAQL